MNDWIKSHKVIAGQLTALTILIFGILLIIGAYKNWDWLYAPDGHYQNNWTLGQVSRYTGRKSARIIGFFGGLLVVFIGGFWSYTLIFK